MLFMPKGWNVPAITGLLGRALRSAGYVAIALTTVLSLGSSRVQAIPLHDTATDIQIHILEHTDQVNPSKENLCAYVCAQSAATFTQPVAPNEVIRQKIKHPKPCLPSRIEQPLRTPQKFIPQPFVVSSSQLYLQICAYRS